MAEEVVLDRTPLPHEPNGKNWGGYAGFSARLGMNLWDAKVYNDKEESKNLHGTKAPFLKFTARGLNGKTHAITIFDNPENPGYPNKWYVSQSHAEPFYYFSPCILFDQKMTLKKGETLKLKYRMLVE